MQKNGHTSLWSEHVFVSVLHPRTPPNVFPSEHVQLSALQSDDVAQGSPGLPSLWAASTPASGTPVDVQPPRDAHAVGQNALGDSHAPPPRHLP